ncbi:transglutaminase domain-containing protein [Amycolatopsis sp. NPDC059021]|uniref:transglutaminase domain-containing protein n=1 Tax=Amycolatopsis sp. NPDC059021 TaxID=3346704 RepID=UPI0036731BEF
MKAAGALRARSDLPVDDWLATLDALFTIPPGYRREDVDRAGALDILRCSDEVLTELVNAGLPHSGDGELFDRHDLFNLALYSKSGVSAAEMGIRFALRWMTRDPHTWFQPMRWNYSLTMTGPSGHGGEATFSVARPLPEAFGGQVERLDTTPGNRDAETPGPDVVVVTDGDTAQVDAVLRTVGEPRTLRSRRLREIVSEYSHGDYRWARMPEELQRHPELVLPHGVAPCISVSLDLAGKARAAGYPARTRRGWILGMLDLAHSWLEVTDDDGQVKIVDPIFAGLADHAGRAHPDFREACFGSALNRLLPTAHEADNGLYHHSRGGTSTVPKSTLTIRAVKELNAVKGEPL